MSRKGIMAIAGADGVLGTGHFEIPNRDHGATRLSTTRQSDRYMCLSQTVQFDFDSEFRSLVSRR